MITLTWIRVRRPAVGAGVARPVGPHHGQGEGEGISLVGVLLHLGEALCCQQVDVAVLKWRNTKGGSMFEKMILRRAEDGPPYTLGDIAEALLYYQNVHLILDDGTLHSLLSQISGDEFFQLLSRQGVSATYLRSVLAIHTVKVAGIEQHNIVGITTVKSAAGRQIESNQDHLELQLQRSGITKPQSVRLAAKLMKKLHFQDQFSNHIVPGGLSKAATDDIFDEAYMRALHEVIRQMPEYTPTLTLTKVDVFKTESGFHAVGGVDLAEFNAQRRRLVNVRPSHIDLR